MRKAWLVPLTSLLLTTVAPASALAGPTQSVQQQIHALQQQVTLLEHQVQALEHKQVAKHARPQAKTQLSARVPVWDIPPASAAVQTAVFTRVTGPVAPVVPVARLAPAQPIPPASSTDNSGASFGPPAPAQNSVKAVYEQQNALFRKGLTITPGATYTYADDRFFTLNGFMALGAIFLGNIDVSRQESSVFTPNVNFTYGVNNRLQFDMTVPFEMRSTTYVSAGANQSSSQTSQKTISTGGIGDINAGFYYQLPQRSVAAPAVVVNAHFTAPTGSAPYGIKLAQDKNNDNLSYADALPTGEGVWGVSSGVTVMKQFDPAILFAGANAYYNFPGHYGDISPFAGTVQPGSVKPGNALSLTLGTAFALNDRMSTSFSFQDSMVGSTAVRADGSQWQTVGGSSFNAGVLNIGVTYAVNKNTSWQTMLGIGVTHDAPSFQLSVRIPHGE